MPFIVCPACGQVAVRAAWREFAGDMFRLECPSCSQSFDIADLETVLRDPRDRGASGR